MPDSTEVLALGLQYHRAGQLTQAEHAYRQVLESDPDNADALSNLGEIYVAQGRLAGAAAVLQQALQLRPHFPEMYNDLGVVLAQQGRAEEAVARFQHALQLKPDYPEAHNNLGILLAQQERLEEAVVHYSQALRLRPAYAEAYNNLGIALARQGKLGEAMASYTQALRLRPDYADAHNNIGLALAEQGDGDAAVASYRRALRLRPDYAEAQYNLGLVLAKMARLDEAVGCYQQALQLKPDYAEVYNELGSVLEKQGQPAAALANLRQALQLKPDYAEAHYNLAVVFRKDGKLDEAIPCYQQVLRLKPDLAEAHVDLGLVCLQQGNFQPGWREYEWRWKCPAVPWQPFLQPLWDGGSLAGRTILLHAEQGLGDTLQFIRYAPLVQQRGGKVLVMCPSSLLDLLARCPGIDRLATEPSALPGFDVHAPLLSLPGIFGTTLATIPAEVPYLFADTQLVEQWRGELDSIPSSLYPSGGEGGDFKVGIAWQGNPTHKQDRERSLPLARFEPLARLPKVRLFSLQVGPGAEQLQLSGDRFPVIDLGKWFNPASFQNPAAVMMNLDLVITVDSAIAHLAGGLGVPVWVLLPFAPDWRWLLEREDSPWYPTMRLFRQKKRGDWDEVFDRLAGALTKLLAEKRPACPEGGEVSMPKSTEVLALALQYHRVGQLHEAEQLYRQVLQSEPDNADALSYLGGVLLFQGRLAEAVAALQQALQLRPHSVAMHNDLGVAFAQQGKADEAAASFRRALEARPDYAEAHNNLGIVLAQRGELSEAILSYRQALRLRPNYAEACNNLGLVLAQQGNLDEAILNYQQALRLRPDYAEAASNLNVAQSQRDQISQAVKTDAPQAEEAVAYNRQAIQLARQGKLEEAAGNFEQALRLNPDYADAHSNLGNIFYLQSRYDSAVTCYERAVCLRPDFAGPYNNLGTALNCLERYQEAAANCRRALSLQPDYAEAHNNLGIALKGQGHVNEAISHYQQAVQLKRNYVEALNNLGLALAERGDWDAAAASYQEAVRLKPDYAEAYCNLGSLRTAQGKPAEAMGCYEQALQYKPDYAEAHLARGVTWLLMGDFERGWPGYAWRLQCRSDILRWSFRQPCWDGGSLAGRPILLHVEQGLGDTLQFIRYAPLVHQRGGRVTVCCPREVVPLLARCHGIDQLLTEMPPDWPDTHASLLDLPGIFGTTLATIPAEVPYLSAGAQRVERWRRELNSLVPHGSLRVGIAWQGNPRHKQDRQRSLPLARFEALGRLPGVRLFSLQVGPGSDQLRNMGERFPVIDLGSRFDPTSIMDAAAVVTGLDLVISVDSAIAHLAGALSVPVWVLLPFAPDWRWLLDREDSPWYPTMRLFRQKKPGDWDEVFDRLDCALTKLLPEEGHNQECGRAVGGEVLMPDHSEALALALQYHRAGHLDQAEQVCRQVLQSEPDSADALSYLGGIYVARGQFAEAAAVMQQALRLRPHFREMYNDLGVVLFQQGRAEEAVASFRQALQLKPDYPEAHNNLGIVLAQQGRLEEAVGHYSQALRLRSDYAEAYNNLGVALARQEKPGDAIASYRQSLRLNPDYAEAHNNLGAVRENQGQLQEALASYEQAVRLKPDYAEAHWNRALLWLLSGDLERGWPEYQWRWKCQGVTMPPFRQPLWNGTPLQGRTILLHAEQGLGDTLQFIRYAPLVQQCGGKVLVTCPPQLLCLLSSCLGIDWLAAQGSPLPEFDVHVPLLDLPGIFATTLATVPAQIPYISAEAQLIRRWRRELDAFGPHEFKVGIAWQGDPTHKRDRQRSLPLARFEPLARLPKVRLFSLQVGPGADQLRDVGDRFPVTDLGSRFDPASFQDAAAVMTSLDLVISVDSALVHLAGALGIPVWVLLPYVPDWRWLLGRDDTPWYPSMRLFRQNELGDWDGVFDRLVSGLGKRVPSTGDAQS